LKKRTKKLLLAAVRMDLTYRTTNKIKVFWFFFFKKELLFFLASCRR
jgi:hypothetical protein